MGEDAMTSRICGECGQLTAFYDTCSCVRQQLANAEARVRELETREQRVESFWWAFWDALIEQDFGYVEMDCEALVTETAVALGLVMRVPFDPATHGDVAGDPEPGDPIYVAALARRTP